MYQIIAKAFKHICSITLILLILSLVLTGCSKGYSVGFGSQHSYEAIEFAVKSDTKIFPINDVTFELYFSLFNIKDYDGARNSYTSSEESHRPIIFCLYVCDEKAETPIWGDHLDSLDIEGHYLLRAFSEDEAFTEEYAMTWHWYRDTYNHHEKVTIPPEVFVEDAGTFEIWILSFHEPVEEGEDYYCTRMNNIEFDYEVIDSETVIIDFEYGVHT